CDSAKHPALPDWKCPGKTPVRAIAARFSTALPGYRAKKCLHGGQDIFDDHIDALSRWMQAVRLVEPGGGGDALQEKRVQRPPEVVSPDTPALIISTAIPLTSKDFCSRAGNADEAERPRPALSESPNTTILIGFVSPAADV